MQKSNPRRALIVPDYAKPRHESDPDPNALSGAAAFFGGLPMGLGAIAFLLYVTTRSDVFAFIAFLALPLGALCFFMGSVALFVHFINIRRPRKLTTFLSTSWLALTLLFANFPAAVSLMFLFSYVRHH
jgi:hypothetical protein